MAEPQVFSEEDFIDSPAQVFSEEDFAPIPTPTPEVSAEPAIPTQEAIPPEGDPIWDLIKAGMGMPQEMPPLTGRPAQFIRRTAVTALPYLATGPGGTLVQTALRAGGSAGMGQLEDMAQGEQPSGGEFVKDTLIDTLFPYLVKGGGKLLNWIYPTRAGTLPGTMEVNREKVRAGTLLADSKSGAQNAAIEAASDIRDATKLPANLQAEVPGQAPISDVDYLITRRLAHARDTTKLGKAPTNIEEGIKNLEQNIEVAQKSIDKAIAEHASEKIANPEVVADRVKATLTRYMEGSGVPTIKEAMDQIGDVSNGILEWKFGYDPKGVIRGLTNLTPDMLTAPSEGLTIATARARMRAIDNKLAGLKAYDKGAPLPAQLKPEQIPALRSFLMEMRTALRDAIVSGLPEGTARGNFLKANERVSRGLSVKAGIEQKANAIASAAGIQTGNSLNANVKSWPVQFLSGATDPEKLRPISGAMRNEDIWARNYNWMANEGRFGFSPPTTPGTLSLAQNVTGPIASNVQMEDPARVLEFGSGLFSNAFSEPPPAPMLLPQTAKAVRDNIATIALRMQDKSMQEQFANKLNGTDAELKKFMAEAVSFDPNLKQLFEPSQSKYPNVLFDVVIDPQTRFQMYQDTARKAHQGDIQSTTWYRDAKKLQRGLAVE